MIYKNKSTDNTTEIPQSPESEYPLRVSGVSSTLSTATSPGAMYVVSEYELLSVLPQHEFSRGHIVITPNYT